MIKNDILSLLKVNGLDYTSGEKISRSLGVSRTAIWKHIKQLKEDGYAIESVTNKGYKLCGLPSDLSAHEVITLPERFPWIQKTYFFETLGSTNEEAKNIAKDEEIDVALIISREQTGGKGRLGRTWESDKDSGIWMSLMLRPKIAPELASKMTLVAAAAISLAIEEVTGLEVKIKWPNDIIISGKKVCGILTEMSAELNHIHHLILGIGINVSQVSFDDSIKEKATSLKMEKPEIPINRIELIEMFVKHFQMYYNHFVEKGNAQKAMEINRLKSATLNKEVLILEGNTTIKAFAKSIDDEGTLIVVLENGLEKAVRSGEVSVRGVEGYI